MAAKQGPTVLFYMPNRTKCILVMLRMAAKQGRCALSCEPARTSYIPFISALPGPSQAAAACAWLDDGPLPCL
jgi:hypothetical protein